MKRLDALAALLAVSDSWTCRGCGADQVAIGGFKAPPERLCETCAAAPLPLAEQLRQAGVPRGLCSFAAAGRQSWTGFFRRPWPKLLPAPQALPAMAYLWGETGTGKTTAAAVLLGEALTVGAAGRFVSGLQLVAELQREVKDQRAASLLDGLIWQPFLVLDEPLAGSPTPWALTQLLRLVGSREAEGLVTIITSQVDPEQLFERDGETSSQLTLQGQSASRSSSPSIPPPLVSRMLSGLRVYFPGEDARLRVEP